MTETFVSRQFNFSGWILLKYYPWWRQLSVDNDQASIKIMLEK
jgi:hypothetical protein